MQSLVLRLGIALAAVFALAIAISPAPATAGNAYFSYGYSNEDIYSVPCASGSRTPTITRFVQRPWGTDKGIASDGTYLYYVVSGSGGTPQQLMRESIANPGSPVQIAGGFGNDSPRLHIPTGGTTLYLQHQNTLYRIPNAATANVSTTKPERTTITSSPGGGRTPAFAVDPTQSTVYYQWYDPTPSGSASVYQASMPTFTNDDNSTFTVSAITGAPTRGGNVTAIAYSGGNLYVPYDAQYDATMIQKWNISGSTWDATFAPLPHDPRNDGGNGQEQTSRVLPADLFSTYNGSRTTLWMIGTGRAGDYVGFLYAYDASSGGWVLMAELGDNGHSNPYIASGAAGDPSCQYDNTKMIPTLKSWESGDAPTTNPSTSTWDNGTTVRLTSNGTWTRKDNSPSGDNTYAYEWQRGDQYSCYSSTFTAIAGETSNAYTATDDDVNKCVRVKITATSADGVVGPSAYVARAVMPTGGGGGGGGAPPIAPTTRGSLAGAAVVGCTVTVTKPIFPEAEAGSAGVSWYRFDSDPTSSGQSGPPTRITGAQNSLDYTLTADDSDKWINVYYEAPLPSGMGTDNFTIGPVASSGDCGASDSDPAPEPGPAMKTSSIGNTLRVSNRANPVVKVPCQATDGELLTECTVQITAPRSVLAGLGGGIQVTNARATKNVTIGKATVTPKTPRKRIVVTVKLNRNGKKAVRRNVRISGLIDLTAVTQTSAENSGRKRVRLQLPRQTMTPTKGIFDTLSTTLNADGITFVKRLAKVLPKKPKRIVCTGYADGYGVPGDNRWLGERRAKALCDELEKHGIKPRSTRLVSRGADDPRASNKTPDGRAKNRRASITHTY